MTDIIDFILLIIIAIISIVLHEVAHGYAALTQGDPTARQAGRLTLNPLAHIDPFLTIILPGLLILSGSSIIFGGARPVPVNPYNFRHGVKSNAIVAASGPLTNFLLAVLFALLLRVFPYSSILLNAVYLNIVLMVFNLIPIPPLDGSRVLELFLSPSARYQLRKIEPYGMLIIFLLIFVFGRFFWTIIGPIINFFVNLIV